MDSDGLAGRYESLRADALSGRAGLAVALLMGQGMAAWMRGWRACSPPPSAPARPASTAPPPEVVGVLASMALACAGGG